MTPVLIKQMRLQLKQTLVLAGPIHSLPGNDRKVAEERMKEAHPYNTNLYVSNSGVSRVGNKWSGPVASASQSSLVFEAWLDFAFEEDDIYGKTNRLLQWFALCTERKPSKKEMQQDLIKKNTLTFDILGGIEVDLSKDAYADVRSCDKIEKELKTILVRFTNKGITPEYFPVELMICSMELLSKMKEP